MAGKFWSMHLTADVNMEQVEYASGTIICHQIGNHIFACCMVGALLHILAPSYSSQLIPHISTVYSYMSGVSVNEVGTNLVLWQITLSDSTIGFFTFMDMAFNFFLTLTESRKYVVFMMLSCNISQCGKVYTAGPFGFYQCD